MEPSDGIETVRSALADKYAGEERLREELVHLLSMYYVMKSEKDMAKGRIAGIKEGLAWMKETPQFLEAYTPTSTIGEPNELERP